MFAERTLFILGAGASYEANLPTGAILMEKIATLLDRRLPQGIDESLGQAIQLVSQGHTGLSSAMWEATQLIRLNMPHAQSIDNFIHAHSGNRALELVGKISIIITILNAERSSLLAAAEVRTSSPDYFRAIKLKDTWYPRLLNMLVGDVQKGDHSRVAKNVSFISFNYDRCIEEYLEKALGLYFDLNRNEGAALANSLSVLHPYGKIAPLPTQANAGSVSFGARPETTGVAGLVNNIQTFTERRTDIVSLDAIRQQVADAQTIIFLGFAFHPLNMDLLTPNRDCSAGRVFATACRESEPNQDVFRRRIRKMLRVGSTTSALDPKIEIVNTTCHDLLRDYAQTLMVD